MAVITTEDFASSPNKVKLVSTLVFALLSFFLTLDLVSWIYVPGANSQDVDLFAQAPYTFMFKYFIWVAVFFYAACISFLRWRLKLLGGLILMDALWLMISALYEYYSIFSLELTVAMSAVIELISIALFISVLITQKPSKVT